jgi:hypothetical protein
LGSGLNFINVLRTAFTPVAPKSVRIQSSSQYLFTLLGSTSAKAVCKTLVKLTPGVNCINVLRTAFVLVDPKSVKNTVKSSVSFMLLGTTSIKAVHRTLMKLSPEGRGCIIKVLVKCW